jgi:hypothetical protein
LIVKQINLVVFMGFRDEIIAGEMVSESVREWEPGSSTKPGGGNRARTIIHGDWIHPPNPEHRPEPSTTSPMRHDSSVWLKDLVQNILALSVRFIP